MEFEWDEAKNDHCRNTRGFDFQFATGVFGDCRRRVVEDGRFDYGEQRLRVSGKINGIIYVVVYNAVWKMPRDIGSPGQPKGGGDLWL